MRKPSVELRTASLAASAGAVKIPARVIFCGFERSLVFAILPGSLRPKRPNVQNPRRCERMRPRLIVRSQETPLPTAEWDQQVEAALVEIQQGSLEDVRAVPDAHRRGRFRLGWHDAAERRRTYSELTLAKLTWHNLGYRLGKHFGPRQDADIYRAFAHAVELLGSASEPVPDGGPLDAAEVSAAGFFAPTQEDRRMAKHHLVLERKVRALRECLVRDQWTCRICGIRMRDRYGLGSDLAEAHHLLPLQRLSAPGRVVVAVTDLMAVCPNCHRAIHRLGCTADALERIRRQLAEGDRAG
jgi:hypothetical protein